MFRKASSVANFLEAGHVAYLQRECLFKASEPSEATVDINVGSCQCLSSLMWDGARMWKFGRQNLHMPLRNPRVYPYLHLEAIVRIMQMSQSRCIQLRLPYRWRPTCYDTNSRKRSVLSFMCAPSSTIFVCSNCQQTSGLGTTGKRCYEMVGTSSITGPAARAVFSPVGITQSRRMQQRPNKPAFRRRLCKRRESSDPLLVITSRNFDKY